MASMKTAILNGVDFRSVKEIEKHADWFDSFRGSYNFTEENTEDILKAEIGKTFVKVLEDAGVYKCTPDGRKAFMRFVESIKGKKIN